MSSSRVTWKGRQIREQIAQRAADAVTEFDLRVEASAKAELYPGHGKRFGTLQRAIYGAPGRVEGKKVRGSIGVRGVRYALPIHRRYKYIHVGFEKERPGFKAILKKHVAR